MDRESLIRGLQEEINEGAKESASGRYNANTQTLLAEKDQAKGKKQINVDVKTYNDIVLGKICFMLTKDIGIRKDETVAFVEVDGFTPTHRITVKQVLQIEKGEKVPEGYCVIGWKV